MILFNGDEANKWQLSIEKFLIDQPATFNSRSSRVEYASDVFLGFLDQLRITYCN